MKLSRLNGWRRLWVVIAALSLVWAVVFALNIALKANPRDYRVIRALEDPQCQHLLSPKSKYSELTKLPEFHPCLALAGTSALSVAGYEAQKSEGYRASLQGGLIFSLLLWVIGLALLYGAGATVAWVRRGFRGGPGRP